MRQHAGQIETYEDAAARVQAVIDAISAERAAGAAMSEPDADAFDETEAVTAAAMVERCRHEVEQGIPSAPPPELAAIFAAFATAGVSTEGYVSPTAHAPALEPAAGNAVAIVQSDPFNRAWIAQHPGRQFWITRTASSWHPVYCVSPRENRPGWSIAAERVDACLTVINSDGCAEAIIHMAEELR